MSAPTVSPTGSVSPWLFVLRMLRREARSSVWKLGLFLACIAVGVGGLVAVKSFSANLERAIEGEARTLMAADMVVRSRRPLGPEEEAALRELEGRGAKVVRSVQFMSMARADGAPTVELVSVRSVGAGYPFYGEVLTGSGQPFRTLLNDNTVLVDPALLLKMGLDVGDTLHIGEGAFRIADLLVKEPDSPVQVFNMGPRVLMTDGGAETTNLVTRTSRVRYSAMVRLPPGMEPGPVAEELRARLPERGSSIDTLERAQPQVTRFMGRLTAFLNLVGLATLLLGGIGVAGAIRVFINQKLDALAVLKCLGATSGRLLAVYLGLALLLGLAGSAVGVLLGYATQAALPAMLAELLPVDFQMRFSVGPALEGLALGLLTTFWFALPPLLAVRGVPPARVFRRHVEGSEDAGRVGLLRQVGVSLASGAYLLALVVVLSLWQAGVGEVAAWFIAGLAGAMAVLRVAAWGLMTLLQRMPQPRAFTLRQGLSSLFRPGNQSAAVLMALGLGVLLVLAVFLTQRDLLNQVRANTTKDQPNLFFIDIQPQQREEFTRVLASHGHPTPELIPVVRARITGLRGAPLRLDDVKDDHDRQHLRFEYALTYRDALVPGEKLVAGAFVRRADYAGPQVSVSEYFAHRAGLEVGHTITMDIQGIPITAMVNSIRTVQWVNRRANFTFVFLPGALEEAPAVYVSAVREATPEARAALQKAVVGALPNISAIDVEMVFTIVQGFMDRIAVVVQFMAVFCIAVGLMILAGAIATTRYQRVRESVLLKTLGATRGRVARVLTVEYLALGLLAGAIGVLCAGALSWGLVTQVFQGNWALEWRPYVAAWLGTAALITLTGVAGSVDVLNRKPLEVLREE